jgi:hypothetical protein
MNNRQTTILAGIAIAIVSIVVIVGIIGTPPASKPATDSNQQPEQSKLSSAELETLLEKELPVISVVLGAQYPTISQLYIIDRGKLYESGQWYATTLTYNGTDQDNRDTLRVIMQKKDGVWIVRTTPPKPILDQPSYPDVPKSIIQDINKPTTLPGTDTSPTINVD